MRLEEALNVRTADINVRNETIRVVGKGSKLRYVPFMSDRFVHELNQIKKKSGYLVVNPMTGKPYISIFTALKRARQKAGISRSVNHHLLRHSFASLAAESGMSPYALQKILGHADLQTTLKVYTHISHDFVGDEARKLRAKNKVIDYRSILRVVK